MTDILREVDEAMKAERMSRLWQENRKTILLGIGAVILGTALNSGWTTWKDHQAKVQTSALIEAMKSKEPAPALEKLSETLKDSGKAMAALDAASLALENKDYEKAVNLYEITGNDKSIPQDFRDLATVQKVSIQIDHNPDAKAEDLLKELSSVSGNKKSAWRLRAMLTEALVKAHLQKDYKGARANLALLSAEPGLPPTMSAQVSALQKVYQTLEQTPATDTPEPAKQEKAEQ